MATPIEKNYGGRMEQLDSQPYFSKGISRRGFLKGAAALAGAAIFGEGFLKQMEAWAQDGVSVYIDNFEIAGDLPQGYYLNVERQIPMKLATILRNRGVNVITRPDKIADDTIVIRGVFSLKEKDPQMRTGYMDLPSESIEINIQYETNGSLSGGKTYKRDARMFPDPMLDEVGTEMAGYLVNRSPPKRQSRSESPDEIVMEIDGKMRRLKKGKLTGEGAERILEGKNPEAVKRYERAGFRIVNKEIYKIID